MMKYFSLILVLYVCSACFAQGLTIKDSIQICYYKGIDGIGGQDHCITVYFENNLIFCKRICYSAFNDMDKYIDTDLSRYEESQKQAILCHYKKNSNYLILDEYVGISEFQLDKLIKIINEIKAYEPKGKSSQDEIIISASRVYYVIKDKDGTTVIFDWLGRYNRRGDIEKVLGLKSYLRCPCVEKDLEQMKNSQKNDK